MKRLLYFIGVMVCLIVFSLYINNSFQLIIAQDIETRLFNDEAAAYRLKDQIMGRFTNAQQDINFLASHLDKTLPKEDEGQPPITQEHIIPKEDEGQPPITQGHIIPKEDEAQPLITRENIISKDGSVLSDFFNSDRMYKEISYYDKNGNEVIHLEDGVFLNQTPIPNKSAEEYFQEALKHGPRQVYASFDDSSLYVCSAMYSKSRVFSGLVVIKLQKDNLLSELQSYVNKSSIILIDDTGKYIFKPASLKGTDFITDNSQTLFAKILSTQSGNIETEKGSLLTYVPIDLDDHRWFLLVKSDKKEVTDYSTTLQHRLTGILFAVILVTFVLLFLWYRSYKKAFLAKQMKKQNEELEVLNANLINKQNELEEQNALVEELNSQLEDESVRYLRQKDTLQVIVDSVSAGIAMTNTEGRVTFTNKGWKELFENRYDGSKGNDETMDFMHDMKSYIKDAELVIPELTRLLKDFEETCTMELEQLKPLHRYITLYSAPCIGENSRVFGRIFVCSDISHEKEVDILKSELISTVSHELRTPMSSILGFSELLLTRSLKPERIKEYIEIIHKEAQRLTNLISDFLDIQKMESGKQIFNKENIEINNIMVDVDELFQNIAENHRLVFNMNGTDTSIVLCDFDKIKQVMSNLLSNAIKYSPDGGEISVDVSVENDFMRIGIRDQGLGIPEEAKDKLFSKFYRVDNDDRRKIGGTGLGLAVCKEIISAHGGKIWAESIHGQGSTFYFTLPLVKSESVKTDSVDYEIPPETDSNKSILVVEDDTSLINLINDTLEVEGFSIYSVNNGEEALKLIREHEFKIIILDIALKGTLNGWDVLNALRGDVKTINIPVIISSAYENKEQALSKDVSEYLVKPFRSNQLLDIVNRVMDLKSTVNMVVNCDENLEKYILSMLKSKKIKVKNIENNGDIITITLDKEEHDTLEG